MYSTTSVLDDHYTLELPLNRKNSPHTSPGANLSALGKITTYTKGRSGLHPVSEESA